MADIFEFKDSGSMREDIKELRKKLAQRLSERDELIYTTCENIKMKYMVEIGYLEYKLYNLSITYQRLKRKKELIQARLYKKERISLIDIEELLEKEFEEYKRKLRERLKEVDDALARSEGKFLSEDDSKALKDMYRTIVKKLHPDLNPHASKEEIDLFMKAVNAYKLGDIENMKLIFEVTGEAGEEDMPKTVLELAEEKSRLEALIMKVELDMEGIKHSFPYNLKAYLDDEKLKRERQAQLRKDIKLFQEAIDNIIDEIQRLMGKRDESVSEQD